VLSVQTSQISQMQLSSMMLAGNRWWFRPSAFRQLLKVWMQPLETDKSLKMGSQTNPSKKSDAMRKTQVSLVPSLATTRR